MFFGNSWNFAIFLHVRNVTFQQIISILILKINFIVNLLFDDLTDTVVEIFKYIRETQFLKFCLH